MLNGVIAAGYRWVILLRDDPVIGRLVYENGRWYVVIDGTRVPVVLDKPGDALPEPDYERFLSWCVKGASSETCGKYVEYLRRFRWPLRREDLYSMSLTKWHILALRSYLNFLEEQGLGVDEWRRLRALRVPRSGSDLYVPPVADVKRSLGLLKPRYRLVYYLILYTGFRLEHVLSLLSSWRSLAARVEPIVGSCVRLALPSEWASGVKREFYAYMPRWLYDAVNRVIDGYKVPRRDTVYKAARRRKAVPPKYVRKFALHHMARLLGPEVAAHIAGHDPGSSIFRSVAATSTTTRHYVSIEDLARNEYHKYAKWVEKNIGSIDSL